MVFSMSKLQKIRTKWFAELYSVANSDWLTRTRDNGLSKRDSTCNSVVSQSYVKDYVCLFKSVIEKNLCIEGEI